MESAFEFSNVMAAASTPSFLIKILLNAGAVLLGAQLLSGITVKDFTRALIVTLVLALLNATLGAFLYFIATPIRWITLGLASWIIDAIIIWMAGSLLKGFEVKSIWSALGLAMIIALVNSIIGTMFA